MLTLALDLAVIGIIAFCGWRGYKNGLIRGVFGVVTLILSLFIASVVASAYSEEFTEILTPFVGGIIDSALVGTAADETGGSAGGGSDAAGDQRAGGSSDAADDEEAGSNAEVDLSGYEDKSNIFISAYSALRRIGLPEISASRVAEQTDKDTEEDTIPASFLSDIISEKLSSALAYAIVFGIAFILLAIVFTVIGNLVGFVFSLPGLRLLDIIAGAAFGVLKGLLIVYALATVVRYVGVFAPDILDGTKVLKFFVNNNLIANRLGI